MQRTVKRLSASYSNYNVYVNERTPREKLVESTTFENMNFRRTSLGRLLRVKLSSPLAVALVQRQPVLTDEQPGFVATAQRPGDFDLLQVPAFLLGQSIVLNASTETSNFYRIKHAQCATCANHTAR